MSPTRRLLLTATLITLCGAGAPARAETHGGISFTRPAGWRQMEQNGRLVLIPPATEAEELLVVLLSPRAELGARTFAAWFAERLKEGAADLTVVQQGETASGMRDGLQTLGTSVVLKDPDGTPIIRLYYAFSDGKHAGLAMVGAGDPKAFEKYGEAAQALLSGLRFQVAGAGPTAPAGPGERVPEAAFAGGKPIGLFVTLRYTLSGFKPGYLLFLPGGRLYSDLPRGGLETVHWPALQQAAPTRCGKWSIAEGTLTVMFGDGRTEAGPMPAEKDGFRWNGKRYRPAASATVAQLAGKWEGVVSVSSFPGDPEKATTTQATDLTLGADGSAASQTTLGSDLSRKDQRGEVISGAVAALEYKPFAGRVEVRGLTMTLRGADGKTRTATFWTWNDDAPVDVFVLDGLMFTRRK